MGARGDFAIGIPTGEPTGLRGRACHQKLQ